MIKHPLLTHYQHGFAQGITSLATAVLARFNGCQVDYLSPTPTPASVISVDTGARGEAAC